MAWSGLAIAVVLLVFFMNTTKTGLIPDEDMGTIFVNVTTPPGSSLAQTKKTMDKIAESIEDIPQLKQFSNVTGYSMLGGQAPSGGMLIIKLKNWKERPEKSDEISAVINQIYARTSHIKSGKIYAFAQPTIMGYGMGSGFELYVQDRAGGDIATLQEHANKFIAGLNQRPEISMAYTSFDTKFPQYMVEVDAVKCQRANVSASDVLSVLSGFIGGNYSSNFNRFSKLYRVMVQADPTKRVTQESLNHFYVRVGDGMAPLSQFVKLTKTYGPQSLSRFNLCNSIAINGNAASGYSSGDALKAIRQTADEVLPQNYGYELGGISREQATTGNNVLIIFAVCIVLVYLILSGMYESLILPLTVILSVPCGLMGSFLFAKLFGLENNIYLQTGLIMLIGLLAKTAILITDYGRAPAQRNVFETGCRGSGEKPSAAYPDDGTHNDIRYAPADVRFGRGSQRQFHARYRCRGRHAGRNHGVAVHRSRPMDVFPVH